jgi:hypothetical protein
MRRRRRQMFDYQFTGHQKMDEISGEYLTSIAVEEADVGIGQVIAIPEKPEDLMDGSDMPSDRSVMYLKVMLANGEEHEMLLLEREATLIGKTAQLYCVGEMIVRAEESGDMDPLQLTLLKALLRQMEEAISDNDEE